MVMPERVRPPVYRRRIGISATCSGTTISADDTDEQQVRPLNSIHENA
jgi:hypothetical protein